MTKIPSVLDLLKSGAHFGHQVSRWHPQMAPYIYGSKNGVHIIDLEKTIEQLAVVQDFIKQIVSNNGTILFLGSKKQVRPILEREAQRCGMPYLREKWIGGFLTNFPVVIRLTKKYNELIMKRDSGELGKYTKKEQLDFKKEIDKLENLILGVKDMNKLPDALFVWDIKKEKTAIKEAKVKKIPIIGVCDTNSNPAGIDYVIPVNDDSSKTIELIMPYLADCVLEYKKEKQAAAGPAKQVILKSK